MIWLPKAKQTAVTLAFFCLTLFPLSAAFSALPNYYTNAANNALAVTGSDGSLYYLDITGDIYAGGHEKIYVLRPGTTLPIALTEDEAWNLNISGKYLYYINWSDNHSIYRLNTDGSDKVKVGNDPINQLTLSDKWLIYSTGNKIYKMSLDGSLKELIVEDKAEKLCVQDQWVYYINANDDYRLYKISLNGTDRTKLSNDRTVFMTVANDSIYYSNYDDNLKLYGIRSDGTNRRKLYDDSVGFINSRDDYVYYTNSTANHALYRIKNTGGNRELIADYSIGPQPINFAGSFIYFNRLLLRP